MTTLTKISIDSCQNFSALNSLISQPGVTLTPHLATLVAKVTSLVDKNYRDLNYRYIGVRDLNAVCQLISKEKTDVLSKKDRINFERISVAARDKIREMNSPYKDKHFLDLIMSIRHDPNSLPDQETQKKMDGVCYQLVQAIYENPVGIRLTVLLRFAFQNPHIFPYVLSFVACKLTVREFCLLFDAAFEEKSLYQLGLLATTLRNCYCAPPNEKSIKLDLERLYGPSFNDTNYRLPPVFLGVLEMTFEAMKNDPSIEKVAYLDNRVAKVPDILMLSCARLIKKVFPNSMDIKIITGD